MKGAQIPVTMREVHGAQLKRRLAIGVGVIATWKQRRATRQVRQAFLSYLCHLLCHSLGPSLLIFFIFIILYSCNSSYFSMAHSQLSPFLRNVYINVPDWRTDGRCGPDFKLADGRDGQCDPNADTFGMNDGTDGPCCSDGGWCGNSRFHCDCAGCTDFSK